MDYADATAAPPPPSSSCRPQSRRSSRCVFIAAGSLLLGALVVVYRAGLLEPEKQVNAGQTIEPVRYEPYVRTTSPTSSLPETSGPTDYAGAKIVNDSSQESTTSPPSTVHMSSLAETSASPSNRPSSSPITTTEVENTLNDPMENDSTTNPVTAAQVTREPSPSPSHMPQEALTTDQTSPPSVENIVNATVESEDGLMPGDTGDDGSIPLADGDLTNIHVVFGDLHFRRVCAQAYSSLLCMIMRLPFEMPIQDPNMTHPSPFDDRFYDIEGLDIIDSQELETCRNYTQTDDGGIDEVVKACLEHAAAESPTRAKLLWTRLTPEAFQEAALYGSNEPGQYDRLLRFFGGNHTIVLLGASPTPGVMFRILDLFGSCQGRRLHRDAMCPGEGASNSSIRLRVEGYNFPAGTSPSESVSERMLAANITAFVQPDDRELQPLTVFAEFPFAHSQTQDLILNHWDQVTEAQTGIAESFWDVYSTKSQQDFAALGFRLERLLAFDGFPQYFPTQTGGYVDRITASKTESEFIANQGYPGWQPEFGTACRGPIPPKSQQTACNQVERDAFAALGFDMRWYGPIREFANLMWFTIAGWRQKPRPALDCTHASGGGNDENDVFYSVHKYMLLAMIDDYYDEIDKE